MTALAGVELESLVSEPDALIEYAMPFPSESKEGYEISVGCTAFQIVPLYFSQWSLPCGLSLVVLLVATPLD